MPDQSPLLFGESNEKMKPDPMPWLPQDSDSIQDQPKTGKHFTGAAGHVFYVKDKAVLTGKFQGIYVIEKINPTTALLVSGARRVKASHSLVHEPGTSWTPPATVAPPANFRPGNLVRIAGLAAGKTYGGLGNGDIGVVLRYSGKRVSVVQVGGSPNGGYGLFTPARLTLVNVTQLLNHLSMKNAEAS